VVTSFEYRAHPVDPEVPFVLTAYPMEQARQVIAGFQSWSTSCPPEASPLLIFWTFPAAEAYPEAVWNRQFLAVAGPYAGPVTEGERVMGPLRALGAPLLDMSGPMPWSVVQKLFDEEYPNGRRYYWKSTYLKELSPGAIDTLIDLGAGRPSPLSSVDVWFQGGALAAPGVGDTAVGHRDAPYLIGIESNWDDPAADATNIAWTRAAAQRLAPYSTGGSYLNFEDMAEAGVTAASHATGFARLVAVKRQYDPDNRFRSRAGLMG
jgi:FAD/FMN-containing dehydrogenase